MTKLTGGYLVPATRHWCLVAACYLVFSAHPTLADVTPTGTVDAVDAVVGGSTPVPPTVGDLTFGPEIRLSFNNGQLVVDNSSVLTAGTIFSLNSGVVIVDGAGSRINLIDTTFGNRLELRGPGNDIQIINGGVFDANSGACAPGLCIFALGSGPGSVASLLVDGAGSALNTTSEFRVAGGNTALGVVGADSVAVVDVLNGGGINSESVAISRGLFGSNIVAGQVTDATVNVSGLGSRWTSTTFSVATGINAVGQVNLTNGGSINTGTFSSALNGSAVADILVDGPGSQINVNGDMLIGQLGTATLNGSNEGQVRVDNNLRIGADINATGTVNFDGDASQLFANTISVGAADGANGDLNVTNGADVFIFDLLGTGSNGFLGVANGLNSTGDVTVTGTGSFLDVGGMIGVVAIGNDFGATGGAGTGSLTISDLGVVQVVGSLRGNSEVLVGFGRDGVLQVDTGGTLLLDGSLSIGEGSTGSVNVMSGGSLVMNDFFGVGVDVADIGIDIGQSRQGDNQDGTGTLSISGPGSSVSVQGADAYIDIASANTAETGTGNASGQLNVTNEATLLVQAELGEIGAILVGVGGTSSAEFNITGLGSAATITGGRGVLLVASDIGQAVGAAQGSLLVDAGATLNIFGSNPGTSVLAIGMGLGDGTGVVSGGSTLNVDGDLFVSASNATILNLFPEIDDEPLSGNDAQTGFLTINDTASVIANFTTIGNRGTLGGTGFLASDTFIDPGGSLEFAGTITGNVFNFGGTVDPGGAGVVGGTLSISGNYSQEAGLLRFSLAGNQPGEFDQLDVSGDIDIFGGAIEVELVNGATTAATNGVPLMLARGALTINEAVAFNVGAGQPAFELVPSEAFLIDPGSGSQVATQIASLNFLEQNLVDVVELASLPPNEASLAASFDDTCGNIAGVSDPTPDEQDLLLVCTDVRNAGNTTAQIVQALDALGTDEVTQTTNSTLLFTIPQHGNLSQRINGIHSGSNPIDFSGLNLRFEEHQIAGADLERFVMGLLGIGAGDADEFSKWGVFGNGNINFGDKNSTDNGNGFDYETITMTIGADYRARDNLVFGGTLSYSDVNADFDEGGGMDLTSWAFSGFGTYFLKDKFYLDLLATYGENEIDVSRHIVYDTVLGGTVRKAKSNTDGDQVSFSFGTGYDFTPGAWVFGPHGGANYTDLETDSYTEKGAGGLNLTIDRQTATSFTANVGFHVAYTYTPEWGVITPYLRADYVREFKDDAEIIEVSFAADRFVNDPLNPSEPIRLSTDERDKEYFVYSAGVSIQLIRGIAGFLNYRTAQNIENLSLTDITWGLRFETEW